MNKMWKKSEQEVAYILILSHFYHAIDAIINVASLLTPR